MKRKLCFLCSFLLLIIFASSGLCGDINSDCTYNGIRLYGRVEVVTIAPDLRVEVVGIAPDLRVEKVDIFPNSCGKWEFVNIAPDFRVEFVDSAPDIRIEYVPIAPGIR